MFGQLQNWFGGESWITVAARIIRQWEHKAHAEPKERRGLNGSQLEVDECHNTKRQAKTNTSHFPMADTFTSQQAQQQIQRIAEKRARERGMQYAAGMKPGGVTSMTRSPEVLEYPGPREVTRIPLAVKRKMAAD